MIVDNTEIQRITKEYYEQLYSNKLECLKEWIHFWTHSLLKLNVEDVENLNRPITSNNMKSPGLDGFAAEFYQTLKKLISILFKLF